METSHYLVTHRGFLILLWTDLQTQETLTWILERQAPLVHQGILSNSFSNTSREQTCQKFAPRQTLLIVPSTSWLLFIWQLCGTCKKYSPPGRNRPYDVIGFIVQRRCFAIGVGRGVVNCSVQDILIPCPIEVIQKWRLLISIHFISHQPNKWRHPEKENIRNRPFAGSSHVTYHLHLRPWPGCSKQD